MLSEFALTPEVFDPGFAGDDHEQWREHLREFMRGAFPDPSGRQVASLLVSNLYGGEWKKRFRTLVAGARDTVDRGLLQSIQQKLDRSLVFRPAIGANPSKEADWVVQAGYSSQRLAIDRVVCSSSMADPPQVCCRVHPMRDSSRRDFWDCLAPQCDPRMVLNDQVHELTPLVVRFPLVAFASPHLHIGSGKDMAFCLALVGALVQRPRGFPPPVRVDLYTHATSLSDAAISALVREVELKARPRPEIRVYCLPKFVERVLLLGELDMGEADIRWGIHLGHVARPALDQPDADPTKWAVLHETVCARWSAKLYGAQLKYVRILPAS